MSIYKKQSDDLKTFETAEEFLKYYDNNKKDIDETHTRSLNLKFKINGHTIGRKQGKLILYPKKSEQKESQETTISNDIDEKYEQLKQAILQLNERLKKLEESLPQDNFSPQQNFTQQPAHQLYYHK